MTEQIGRYVVRALVGKGGFGTVYRAWDPVMKREVAIKVLTAADDPDMVARFRSESATTGLLKHKNIITVYDFGEQDSSPYLVMELLEGRSLREVIDRGPALSLPEKVRIMEEIGRGLAHAHQADVIHRDIKPGNIMLLADGTLKILDFGIGRIVNPALTRHTSTGMMVGTPEYMAPEQFAGEDASALSDIFAYGVVCYELLTGIQPFRGPHLAAVSYAIANKIPTTLRTALPGCPEALEAMVQKALAKSPAERYQRVQELLLELGPIEAGFRKDRLNAIVAEAQQLLDAGDLDRAQQTVERALELEPGHPASWELRRRIQRQRERAGVENRWMAAIAQAESLLRGNAFDEAIQTLEGMRGALTAESLGDFRADLEARLTAAQEAREKARRIESLLVEAQEAAGRRDLAIVVRAAAAVLALDAGNSVALAQANWATEEVEQERQRQEEVGKVTQIVWKDILVRRFDAADRSITEAHQRYPGDVDLLTLQSVVDAARKAPPPQDAWVPQAPIPVSTPVAPKVPVLLARQSVVEAAREGLPPRDVDVPPTPIPTPPEEKVPLPRPPPAPRKTRRMIWLTVGGTLVVAAVAAIWWPRLFPTPAVVNPPQIPGKTNTAQAKPASDSPPQVLAKADTAQVKMKVNPKDGLTYVWIPPGTFQMGCSSGDNKCYENEKPAHQVTIGKGFWIGQTEVTQEAWQKVMGTTPSHFKGSPQLPVEEISWTDAKDYCEKVDMRLPTEAEWEYAARAGTTGSRYGELDQIAWYGGNSGGKTHKVKGKLPNALGLYDMIGNVWEWTADWYQDKYAPENVTDPTGPASGQYRPVRGASWFDGPRGERASDRFRCDPAPHGWFGLGARCGGN